MHTLYLMRHASSKSAHGEIPDHDRPLSFEGRGQLQNLCEKAVGLFDDVSLVLVSSSLRTRQTLEGIKDIMPRTAEIHVLDSLYMASVETILEDLETFGDDHKKVLVIAHNPGVTDLLTRVLGHTNLGALGSMGTSNVAIFDTEKPSWDGVRSADLIFRELVR